MSTTPATIDPILQPLADRLASDSSTIQADTQQIASDQQQELTDQSQITQLNATIAALNKQVAQSQPAKSFRNLERKTWLVAGGTAANTGSVGSTAGLSVTPPTNAFSLVTIVPSGPYADKYLYQTLGPDPTLIRFRQFGSIYFPTLADANASQCWESDLPQILDASLGNWYFDWGMQYDFAENQLRVWNKKTGNWVATGKPMPRFKPGVWIDHVIECHREGNSVIYDQLTVGGEPQLKDVIDFPALQLDGTHAPIFNYGLQPDGDKTADRYSVALNNFGLDCWTA